MRILCVHNRYQQRGGEDQVFESESALLERYGHQVKRLEFSNTTIPANPSPAQQLRMAASTIWSPASAKRIGEQLLGWNADVVHFTNTFPIASPSVYATAKSAGSAVVQTVQNYRLICPSANLYRNGGICEDCVGRSVPWPGIVHGCYRASRKQTAVVSAMITAHRLRGTWNNDVDAYVAATNISREKLIEGGLPSEKIYVKPNFLDHPPERKSMLGNHCLFVGRLTEEKGVRTLLDAWQTYDLDISLKIAGTGPLEELVQQAASVNANIQPLGMQTRLEVLAEMEQAYVLIFPSVWYEGLPMTLVEALASGLPCIASNLGAMVEVVTDGETGLLFAPGSAEQLAAKVRWAFQQPELVCQMGQNARSEFDTKYSPERNYELLMGVYERAIEVRRRSGHS